MSALDYPMFEQCCAFLSYSFREKIQTMPAKSLGTLPMIYAIDELQNPLPRKTMLFEENMTTVFGRSDALPNS